MPSPTLAQGTGAMPVSAAIRLSPQSAARNKQNRPCPTAPTAEGSQIAPARPPASTGVQKWFPES
eukprot:7234431-Alexandrium_andersonii.AAC.1